MKSCLKGNFGDLFRKIVYFAGEKAPAESEKNNFEAEIKDVADVRLHMGFSIEEAKKKVDEVKTQIDRIVTKYKNEEEVKRVAEQAKERLNQNYLRFEAEKRYCDKVVKSTQDFLRSKLQNDFNRGQPSLELAEYYEGEVRNFDAKVQDLKNEFLTVFGHEQMTVNLLNSFLEVFSLYKDKFEKWKKEKQGDILSKKNDQNDRGRIDYFKAEFEALNNQLSDLDNSLAKHVRVSNLDSFLQFKAELDLWNPRTTQYINEKAKLKLEVEKKIGELKKQIKGSFYSSSGEKENLDAYVQAKQKFLAAEGALKAKNVSEQKRVKLEAMKNLAEKRVKQLEEKMAVKVKDKEGKVEKNISGNA